MSIAVATGASRGLLHVRSDAWLIALAAGYGGLMLAVPIAPVVALGVWWGSNTVAHYFLHRPFFRIRSLNVLFSLYLSILLGVPQELWKVRHLTHHFGPTGKGRRELLLLVQCLLIAFLWGSLLAVVPKYFLSAYLPGYIVALGLCWLHGYYEHQHGTTSHYGRLYNFLFFNDGYHVEHHRHPETHWTALPEQTWSDAHTSRWPAVLRWLDCFSLEGLERMVLRSPRLQRWVLARHEQAFRRLFSALPSPSRIGIIGGGMFPRTALIMQRLYPSAQLMIIDLNADSIRTARSMIEGNVRFIHERYDPSRVHDLDLLVFPLSFQGNREAPYRPICGGAVVVHDWIWRRRGSGAVVSWLLFKRLNLLHPQHLETRNP